MPSSDNRFATTHVGSLPRSLPLSNVLHARESGADVPQAQFDEVASEAVSDVVRRQVEIGIDVVSDGEMSKITYATYVKDRLTGFDGDTKRLPALDLAGHADFASRMASFVGEQRFQRQSCVGPIEYVGYNDLHGDLARLTAASDLFRPDQCFMNAASPGLVSAFQGNLYYPTHEAYVEAIGEAMRIEYEAIAGAGFLLQVDCPDLAMARHTGFQELSDDEFLARAHHAVEVLNHALRNIPADRLRMHVCWGNYEGPHDHDIDLATILPVILEARPSFILFEAANPRHAHEWTTWRSASIPDDKILVPGVIMSTTNYVEHPELVAQRLRQFAAIVGRERVMAGTDCGFGTFAGIGKVDGEIAYKKLTALVRGAELASTVPPTAVANDVGARADVGAKIEAIERECEKLVIRSAALNDARDWTGLASLYTDDATLVRPSGEEIRGRDSIEASYAKSPTNRLTRHLCANWSCVVVSETEARATMTVLLCSSVLEPAADGVPKPSATTFAVGEFSDRLVLADDGWRIAARIATVSLTT